MIISIVYNLSIAKSDRKNFLPFLMTTKLTVIVIAILCLVFGKTNAQPTGRIIGARSFEIDDGSGSGKSLRLDVTSTIGNSYVLHLPSAPPITGGMFLSVDPTGIASWQNGTLLPLPPGNIWVGNA